MTLPLKSWLEVRRRFLIALLGWSFAFASFYISTLGENPHKETARSHEALSTICAVEIVMLMAFSSVLAGCGVTSQSCSAMSARMPDSVLFTLSLPVSRRGLFLTRAAIGGGWVLLIIPLFWAMLPILLPRFIAAAPPLGVFLTALLFQLVAAALAYCLKLIATCVVSEIIQAWMVGAFAIIGWIGLGLHWTPVVRFLDFASGATYIMSGQISWIGLAACVALSCCSVFVALSIIERRQF